jgi:hypothetical protein
VPSAKAAAQAPHRLRVMANVALTVSYAASAAGSRPLKSFTPNIANDASVAR